MDNELNKGIFSKRSILVFITLSFVSIFVGYLISAILEYFITGEALVKIIRQQIIVAIKNTAMIAVIGCPIIKILTIAKLNHNKIDKKQKETKTELNKILQNFLYFF